MNPQQIKQLNDILNKKQNVSQKFISAVQMDDPETAIRFLHRFWIKKYDMSGIT